jgi:hypothetical protein
LALKHFFSTLDDRDYRSSRGERDRDMERGREDNSGGHGATSNAPTNSLFAEMLKKKKNRVLLEKRKSETSVVVNSELSDPRNPTLQRQASVMPSGVPTGVPPPDPRYSMAMAAANGQALTPNLSKKGPKAPPHRPGALPMPPGMDIGGMRGILNDSAASSSFNDSRRGSSRSSRLVRIYLNRFGFIIHSFLI